MIKATQESPNAIELDWNNGSCLFSYGVLVAARANGVPYKTSEHHSVTTSKHVNQWLGVRDNIKAVEPQLLEELVAKSISLKD